MRYKPRPITIYERRRHRFGDMPPLSHWPDKTKSFDWAESAVCRWLADIEPNVPYPRLFAHVQDAGAILFDADANTWRGCHFQPAEDYNGGSATNTKPNRPTIMKNEPTSPETSETHTQPELPTPDKTAPRPSHARDRGHGKPSAMDILPDRDETMAKRLEEAMSATEQKWSNKDQTFVEFPDHRTRLDALKTCLAYRLGMPAQMRINIEASGFKDQQTEMVELARSPMGRQMLLRAGVIDEQWLERHVPEVSSASRR